MNIVNVIGNVTRDPEVMFTKSGMAKVKFSVASNSRYTSKDGEQKEATDYINVVAWGKLAESISEAVFKGTPVMVQGRYTISSYEGRDGEKNYYTCVTASFVGVSVYKSANARNGGRKNTNTNKYADNGFSDMGQETTEPIPF
ncbi:single-stranded DNA-binding protein [Megasphaera sp.]|uniref:single-stranded DNA-binding protein n=1 Tax=Megasphaera sp. TaxID=2023260 RepID=UPI0035227582